MANKENEKRARFPEALGAKGFSIAAAMIATLIVGVVTVGGTLLYADYKQDQVAQGRGRQLGMGLEQLDKFAHKYQAQLTAGTSIPGVANAYAPLASELQALGYAAPGFSDTSQPGGAIVFQIEREPAGCAAAKCILALRAVTSGSVQAKGITDAPFAQRIAGYVPNGAGWSNLANDPAKLGKNGRTIPNPLGNVPSIVAAVAWLGSGQSSQTVPPVYYTYRTIGCPSGYSGGQDQQQGVTTDKWGNTTTGAWITYADNCVANPPPAPPTCANGASDYPTCTPVSSGSGSGSGSDPGSGSGSGSGSTTDPGNPTGTCPNLATDYPTCTPPKCLNGAPDYPTCTPPKCSNGAPDYPTCTPPVCANGADNYPTCTITPPPPPCPPEGTYCDTWGGSDGSLWDAPPMGYGKIIYSGPQCKATYVQVGTYLPVNGCPV